MIQVMINGTDVKEFRFSHVMECVYPATKYFCSSFCSEYGYNPDRNATIAYEANVPLITGDRAHFIVFGYGKGFYDGAQEAEDGTAVILSNGNSIMIYSGGDGTDKFKKLHAVLLKIIAETPTEDGKKSVNIPYGVTVVNMK